MAMMGVEDSSLQADLRPMKSINQSINTNFYSAVRRERIGGAYKARFPSKQPIMVATASTEHSYWLALTQAPANRNARSKQWQP